MPRRFKKSKYKYAKIGKKKYFFYSIKWVDITGDSSHATPEEFDKFAPSIMRTQAYIYKKNKKYLWTFSSYDEDDEVFRDTNILPAGCIVSMERITL